MEKNRYLHYGLVLTGIAFLSALILAVVNDKTAPIIAGNDIITVNNARKKVLPLAQTFVAAEAIKKEELEFIPGKNEAGELMGYVVSGSENGYAGAIKFVIGIGKDGKMTGVDIVGHQETPGLGSKIIGEEWKKHWIGKDSAHKFNKTVDGFAGATISPEAVHKGLVKVLNVFDKEVK